MEKAIIKILVSELASLLSWRDNVQQMAYAKSTWEYEHELMEKIEDALKSPTK